MWVRLGKEPSVLISEAPIITIHRAFRKGGLPTSKAYNEDESTEKRISCRFLQSEQGHGGDWDVEEALGSNQYAERQVVRITVQRNFEGVTVAQPQYKEDDRKNFQSS